MGDLVPSSSSGRELSGHDFQLNHAIKPPDAYQLDKARRVCAEYANDADDLVCILMVLGLISAQPAPEKGLR